MGFFGGQLVVLGHNGPQIVFWCKLAPTHLLLDLHRRIDISHYVDGGRLDLFGCHIASFSASKYSNF